MRTHDQSVQDQFNDRAQAYLHSAVHAQGPDLGHAAQLVGRHLSSSSAALDIGCGAGHLSFALAPQLRRMVALDPSPNMITTVAEAARARGLAIETRQAGAESLPFDAHSFDLVSSRYSAHHWLALEAALRQMRRVVRPDGFALIIDTLAPEEALVDTHLQAMELLRDPSHVRNRSASQWTSLLREAGFELVEHQQWPTRLEFKTWGERMRTSNQRIAMIRTLQSEAPREVQQALRFEEDGSFTMHTGLFWARPIR